MEPETLDRILKLLLLDGGPELVEWLTGRRPLETSADPTEVISLLKRPTDHILRALIPGNPPRVHFLHVEIQTGGDPRMPERMHEYWTLAVASLGRKRSALDSSRGGPIRLSSFVIYLEKKHYLHDPGEYWYVDGFGTETIHRYRVIKLWELDPATILRLRPPFLAPLTPFMASPDPLGPVLQSWEQILGASSEELTRRQRSDLLGALAILADRVLGKDQRFLIMSTRAELQQWIEETPIVQEWKRLGKVEGRLLEACENLIEVVRARFGSIDPGLEAAISRIQDPIVLRDLLRKAAVAPSMEVFSREFPAGGTSQSRGR